MSAWDSESRIELKNGKVVWTMEPWVAREYSYIVEREGHRLGDKGFIDDSRTLFDLANEEEDRRAALHRR